MISLCDLKPCWQKWLKKRSRNLGLQIQLDAMNFPRPRFSVKAALLFTAAVAGICYWRSRPAVIAQGFVDAINKSDYAAADALFAQDKFQFVVRHQQKHPKNKISASRSRQSLTDWLEGKCTVNVFMDIWSESADTPSDGNKHWLMSISDNRTVDATALGLQKPQGGIFQGL